jgi:thymidylate synthase (FAD)
MENWILTKVLDHGYVNFIESWGSDERIIEAARMSTDKGFQGWGPHTPSCAVRSAVWDCDCEKDYKGDEKLLKYLYDHKHMTPFEMAGMTIEVQAPIMVFREWQRHRTQSYNELSGRYTELPDLYYIPSIERLMAGKQAKTNKQSSEAGFTKEQAAFFRENIEASTGDSRAAYEWTLKQGVSREIARLVLPVNQYSRMRASANLRNWLAFLTLRMDEGAQWEIRQYANTVAEIVAEKFPRTYELFARS